MVTAVANANRAVAARQRRASVASVRPTVLPAVLMVYAAMLPDEVRIVVGDQNLYATRIVGLLLLPWLARALSQRIVRFSIVDLFVIAAGTWMVMSFVGYYGFERGLNKGVAIAIDVLLPYFIARLTLRSPNDFRRLLVLVAPGVAISGLSMFAETLAGREIVRPAFASVFGKLPDFLGGGDVRAEFIDYRWGLLRVAGPFSQPIIAGVYMASLFGMYSTARLRGLPYLVGLATLFFAFLSLSSAAFFALTSITGLLAVDYFQRRTVFFGWTQTLTVLISLAVMIQTISNRGLLGLAASFSFNPETAYFRRLIWEYATISVAKHPWIGTALTPYERPFYMRTTSVDHYWLSLALRNGLPVPVLLFIASVLAVLASLAAAGRARDETTRYMMVGFSITMGTLIASEFTFSLFGVMLAWHYFLMGAIVSIAASVRRAPVMARQMPSPSAAPERGKGASSA